MLHLCVHFLYYDTQVYLICDPIELELQFSLIIPEEFKFKVRERVYRDLQYFILFINGQDCIWYPNTTCEL